MTSLDDAGAVDVARDGDRPWAGRRLLPIAIGGGVLVIALVYLRFAGRVWWCECRTPTLFVVDPATAHNSQHFIDWYSFSHLLHGVIFFLALQWALPGARLPLWWKLAVAVVVETGWEVLENSPVVIERYRTATASLGYTGDSIVNSIGDILFCVGGFFLARAIGWRWSLAIFVVTELVMLAMIRDNLTLNVVMLLYPLESIKQWQMAL